MAFACFILAVHQCSEMQLLTSRQKGVRRSLLVAAMAAMEDQALGRNRTKPLIEVWGIGSKRGFLRAQVRAYRQYRNNAFLL